VARLLRQRACPFTGSEAPLAVAESPPSTPRRVVAASLELYDGTQGRQFSVLDYLFNPNSTQPVSSFTATPLEVAAQSFYSRLLPRGAAVTRTEQGITAKQLLLLTNTDQVRACGTAGSFGRPS
jgi:hypothetical protein